MARAQEFLGSVAPGDIGDITAPSSSPSNSPSAELGAKSGRPDPGAHPPVLAARGGGRPPCPSAGASCHDTGNHTPGGGPRRSHTSSVDCGQVRRMATRLPAPHRPPARRGTRFAQRPAGCPYSGRPVRGAGPRGCRPGRLTPGPCGSRPCTPSSRRGSPSRATCSRSASTAPGSTSSAASS